MSGSGKEEWLIRKEVHNHVLKYNIFNPNIIMTSTVFTPQDIENAFNQLINSWDITHHDESTYCQVRDFWKKLHPKEQFNLVNSNYIKIKFIFINRLKNWDNYDCLFNLALSLYTIISHDLLNEME